MCSSLIWKDTGTTKRSAGLLRSSPDALRRSRTLALIRVAIVRLNCQRLRQRISLQPITGQLGLALDIPLHQLLMFRNLVPGKKDAAGCESITGQDDSD